MEIIISILKGFLKYAFDFGFSSREGVYSVRKIVKQDTVAAAVSYVPLVSPAILLLRKRNSDFVISHSKQALILSHITLSAVILAPYLILFVRGFLIIFLAILIYKSFTEKTQLFTMFVVGCVLVLSVLLSDYVVYLTLLLLVLYIILSIYRALRGKRIHIPMFTELASVVEF